MTIETDSLDVFKCVSMCYDFSLSKQKPSKLWQIEHQQNQQNHQQNHQNYGPHFAGNFEQNQQIEIPYGQQDIVQLEEALHCRLWRMHRQA